MGEFVKVATTAEMQNQPASKLVDAGGQAIALFQVAGSYYAIENLCSHRGGSLADGMLDGHEVTCPWHVARFDIRTGAHLCPPAPQGVKSFPVRINGSDIEIEV